MNAHFETRQVEVFLVLAEELSFAQTAERVGVTPSRVSQIIRSLEAQVGAPLFDRTSRAVALTPLGEQLRADASPAFSALRAAFNAARERSHGVAGVLRLVMYSAINGGPRLHDILQAFEAAHPACQVRLQETGFDGHAADRALGQGEADLLATRPPVLREDLVAGPELSREPRVVLVGEDHPLAERSSVVYEDLVGYRVTDCADFPKEVMDALIPPVTASGVRLERLVLSSLLQIWGEIAAGRLVHPTVPSLLEHHPHPGIVSVPIRDLPDATTVLVWRRDRESAAIRALAQIAAGLVAQPPVNGGASTAKHRYALS